VTSVSFRKAEAARELEQFEQAERVLTKLRWLGMASWLWLLTRREWSVPAAWPYAILAASVAYTATVFVLIRRARQLRALAFATTLGDAAIVTLMCLVTGGIHSDFYPYYYITVLAASVRFGPRETFLALVLNSFCSTLVFLFAPGPSYPATDLLLEIYYMLFIALMSSWLARLVREHYRRALVEGDKAALLLAVNREITSTLDLSDLLGRILRAAANVIPCRGAAILLLDRNRHGLERALVTDGFAEPAAAAIEAAVRQGTLREELVRAFAARDVAVVTIHRREDLGFLAMVDKAGGEDFTDEDRALVSAVGDQAAVAIENARLVEDVLEARDRGQELLWRLLHAEEEERKRVAGEIHDRMGARFFEFFYSLRRCQEELGRRDAAAGAILSRLASEAQGFSDEIRNIMNELRPTVLDDFGFIEALREYVASLEGQSGLKVTLRIDDPVPPVRAEVGVMLFRVLQEAVLNVRKHADARHLAVELAALNGAEVRLVIRDDGVGFDPSSPKRGHYGLLHMKERAEAYGGHLTIESRPHGGTEVRVTVGRGGEA
jgi:signal transduction histidine kinase